MITSYLQQIVALREVEVVARHLRPYARALDAHTGQNTQLAAAVVDLGDKDPRVCSYELSSSG
jgi:hypothetical protein